VGVLDDYHLSKLSGLYRGGDQVKSNNWLATEINNIWTALDARKLQSDELENKFELLYEQITHAFRFITVIEKALKLHGIVIENPISEAVK
jgi:hypothetical protein